MLLQSYNKSLTTNTKSELNYLFFYFFFKISQLQPIIFFFFFNDPATTEISPLPLPDALPISDRAAGSRGAALLAVRRAATGGNRPAGPVGLARPRRGGDLPGTHPVWKAAPAGLARPEAR